MFIIEKLWQKVIGFRFCFQKMENILINPLGGQSFQKDIMKRINGFKNIFSLIFCQSHLYKNQLLF